MRRIAFGLLLASSIVSANGYDVGAAKGLMIASILHEKCTGKPPVKNETERQVAMLQGQGMAFEDIQRGFLEGMIYAEGAYPKGKRVPQKECDKAISLYYQSLKVMR